MADADAIGAACASDALAVGGLELFTTEDIAGLSAEPVAEAAAEIAGVEER